ncbi:MAG TPA: hypothetical protein VFT56_06275 [Sphingomonas sp.]|nr:hypothetical protein [Sphingomonas sp.]
MTDPSLRLMSLPLAELGDPSSVLEITSSGLPAHALEIADARLVLAATPCQPPMFTGVAQHAARWLAKDVLMIRAGLHPETLNPVTVDVALCMPSGILSFDEMVFCRHADHSLWLVERAQPPFVRITPRGLLVETVSPWPSVWQIGEAACAAAAEIVRLSTQRGR